jgi:hypothetical protein
LPWCNRVPAKAAIYGAIGGYQGAGQTVYAELAAQRGVDGRRQLNAPPGGEHGYKVRRGFSGAPVFDELGNTIWGMVVTVETNPGIYVAFSIPAGDLRERRRQSAPVERRSRSARQSHSTRLPAMR